MVMGMEVSPLLRAAFVGAGVASVYASAVLTFAPEHTAVLFAWNIQPPMTALFIGAFFAIGVGNQFLLARRGTSWRTARVAMPALFTLSATMLVATALHADRFLWGRPVAWLWLGLYVTYGIAVPVFAFTHERRARRHPRPEPRVAIHRSVSACALAVAAVVGLLGLALMIAPTTVGGLWPWQLTPLTGRVTGGWLLFLAAALIGVAQERDWEAVRPNLPFLSVAGVLLAIGMVRYPIDWSLPQTWVYGIAVAALTVAPLAVFQAYERRRVPIA